MKKFPALLTLIFTFAICAAAQQVKPSPKPTPSDEDVVKISTNLIQIDVSVTDKNGKPVTDLRPEEVEVYENGEKQKITNFSFISATRFVEQKPKQPDKTGVPPPPTQVLRPGQIRRTIALVVDDLSLSFE